MEKQKALTDKIAAAIFYGKTEPVEIPGKGTIRIHAEYTKNGYSSIVKFSFTDELVQKEYDDFYKRAVGTRDNIEWKDGKIERVKFSQIDLFLHKLLNDTLHKRHQPFLTDEVKKTLIKYPYRSQDGKGMKAKVIMRFFNLVGTGTWYVTEMADVQMKNADAIKMTEERRKASLKILKNIEARLAKSQANEKTNWSDASSMGAILDKLIETETFTTYLD